MANDTFYSIDAVVQWKAGGIAGGGAFAELLNVRDVRLGHSGREVDTSTRDSAFGMTGVSLIDATVEIEVLWDSADTGCEALRSAMYGRTVMGLEIRDRSATGKGLKADFMVVGFDRDEDLEGALTATFTLKITRSATAPSWVTS